MKTRFNKERDKNYGLSLFDESQTEQEHKESCDINIQISRALRGLPVQGASGRDPKYGYDDTTMSGLTFRIQKAETEEELARLAQTEEISEEDLQYIPEHIRKKYPFKIKQKTTASEPENNDQTMKTGFSNPPQLSDEPEKTDVKSEKQNQPGKSGHSSSRKS